MHSSTCTDIHCIVTLFHIIIEFYVTDLIEKTTWSNIKDHNDALVKALLAECDGEMPKGRKGRRRHRAISSNPVLLPVDHLPSSTRSPSYKPGKEGTLHHSKNKKCILF